MTLPAAGACHGASVVLEVPGTSQIGGSECWSWIPPLNATVSPRLSQQ